MNGETHLIHSFPKSEGEEIQLALKKFKGKYYIDLRIWFQVEKGGELKPTKKGVFFSIEQMPQLQRGVERLAKAVERVRYQSPKTQTMLQAE